MKLIYPSKSFLNNASRALNVHEILEISISGWRGKVLSKEVKSWPTILMDSRIATKTFKAPSTMCNVFMIPLLTIHYAALSASYKLRSEVNGENVTLIYMPL